MLLLSRAARRKYGLDDLVDASPSRVRELAHAVNRERRTADGGHVHAGELGALALLQDLLAGALADALGDDESATLNEALDALEVELGSAAVNEFLREFRAEFEGVGERATGGDPASGELDAAGERPAALAALFVLWQLNRNPAVEPLRELIDDRLLAPEIYARAMGILEQRLRRSTQGAVPLAGNLIDRIEAPARAEPRSIAGQLELYLDQPTEAMGVPRERLERALDALEEERVRPPAGPGPIELPPVTDAGPVTYARPPRAEPAWMRELVLTAKHTHVWLDQISRGRGTEITRLDQVPDAELARLVELGLSGLWLVGVWERSPASQRIKRLAGNAEAAASAYSVFDYRVAADLGGDDALAQLQERALAHGLRLGVDVVPNHCGIDSRWLRDHPERFLAVDECPFPGYTFDGPDLSGDPDVGLFLEDHYYDRSDAAVVFRHLDRRSGRERFIYHGNDGTTTPWNDTAQLDYTQPEVRAAMTELIVDLAGRFRILRFDAAMTLTRLHFQRLWFPGPGSGGAVPSRSEHGMGTEEFVHLMPAEFWLEVVERVEVEAADTLLIAEAFWLMEPYFVRELGMHRVYNSAFMHLLRERDNLRFQRLLRDTAAHDPELLRRSVNFMSTPDEASAAAQFGTGDRYFGVCTLLAALPGPPLFGHGQIEGLAEKYGMEYLRARSGEVPDAEFLARHRRDIAPLLEERRNFTEPGRMHLLDFAGPGGQTWFDVYALCSSNGDSSRLVVFNNSDRAVGGVVRGGVLSGPLAPEQLDVATLLGLGGEGDEVYTLRDERAGVEFSGRVSDLRQRGLDLVLEPWQSLVLKPVR